MNTGRVFVMLAWEPTLGALVYPVGVFGLPYGTGAEVTELCVSWVPMTYERSLIWRRRLARPVTAELVDAWLADGQLAESPAQAPADSSLLDIVEGLLDEVLVELLPALHERRAG